MEHVGASWFERAMTESPEERQFFADEYATDADWRVEESIRIAEWRAKLKANLAAQAAAPEGRYAYMYNEWGVAVRSPHTTEILDEDGDLTDRIRIRAATRRI